MKKLKNTCKAFWIATILSAVALLMHSCTKQTDHDAPQTSGNVSVRLVGDATTDFDFGSGKRAALQRSSVLSSEAIATQKQVLPFGGGTLTATLTMDEEDKKVFLNRRESVSNGNKAAAVETVKPMPAGIVYTLLVYDADGQLVAQKTFRNLNEDSDGLLELPSNKTYTFIAVSRRNFTAPVISNATNLSTASIENLTIGPNGGTMNVLYFKKTMEVSNAETTHLDVVLTHKTAQVTTTIIMDPVSAALGARIKRVTDAKIGPSHASAVFNLADASFNYGATYDGGSNVRFAAVQAGGVESHRAPVNPIMAEANGTGFFNIGALTLTTGNEQIEMTDQVSLSGLSILPGYRYNLNLTFATPCVEMVGVAQDFTGQNYPPNPVDGTYVETTHTFPAADFGFVFDIYEVDNSFNMIVNGVQLATNELQFERNIPGLPNNIVFDDGTSWGSGVSEIWYLHGDRTTNRPIVRVVISADGTVTMFASKVSGNDSSWTLIPLQTLPGTSFNKVNWNTASTNTVTVRQLVAGITNIDGNGRGYRKIDCGN